MSNRHTWLRLKRPAWRDVELCKSCLMLRRRVSPNRWEYQPASITGWEHAPRTCGPCPGKP